MIGLQKSQPDKIFCQEVAEDFHLLTSQQQMKKFSSAPFASLR